MSYLKVLVSIFLFLLITLIVNLPVTQAQQKPVSCTKPEFTKAVVSSEFSGKQALGQPIEVKVTFDNRFYDDKFNYFISVKGEGMSDINTSKFTVNKDTAQSTTTAIFRIDGGASYPTTHRVYLKHSETIIGDETICELGSFTVYEPSLEKELNCSLSIPSNIQFSTAFDMNFFGPPASNLTYTLSFFEAAKAPSIDRDVKIAANQNDPILGQPAAYTKKDIPGGNSVIKYTTTGNPRLTRGSYIATITARKKIDRSKELRKVCFATSFDVSNDPTNSSFIANPTNIEPKAAISISWNNRQNPLPDDWISLYEQDKPEVGYYSGLYTSSCASTPGTTAQASGICSNFEAPEKPGLYEFRLYSNGELKEKSNTIIVSNKQNAKTPPCVAGSRSCTRSVGESCKDGIVGSGVMTAIGCVPTQPVELVNGLIRVTSLAAGGLALMLMILGALKWITSAGDPNELKKAQDQFTNAFIGLLFIIFATLLLQIIGVDLLSLPGFGR